MRLRQVEARLPHATARVLGYTTGARRFPRMPGAVPVGGPFPNIAGHVVESIAIGRKVTDRRRAFPPVGAQVLPRELATPEIGHLTPLGRQLVAPHEFRTIEATARGE